MVYMKMIGTSIRTFCHRGRFGDKKTLEKVQRWNLMLVAHRFFFTLASDRRKTLTQRKIHRSRQHFCFREFEKLHGAIDSLEMVSLHSLFFQILSSFCEIARGGKITRGEKGPTYSQT